MVAFRRASCAVCIQRSWWSYLAHKLHASTVIQCLARRVKARGRVARLRVENGCASVIQCLFRKKIARRVFFTLLKKWKGQILVACNWRGYACR